MLGGVLGYLRGRKWRDITKGNFAVVLGTTAGHPEVAGVARRAFRNFGKDLTEIVRFPSMGQAELNELVAEY